MLENHTQLNTDKQHAVETFSAANHTDPLLAARGARYGTFIQNGIISQGLKDVMRCTPGWAKLDPDMKEALEQHCLKVSRILSGDPRYDDNWVDIAGYATRVADRLQRDNGK
jgi:hypothetical protein